MIWFDKITDDDPHHYERDIDTEVEELERQLEQQQDTLLKNLKSAPISPQHPSVGEAASRIECGMKEIQDLKDKFTLLRDKPREARETAVARDEASKYFSWTQRFNLSSRILVEIQLLETYVQRNAMDTSVHGMHGAVYLRNAAV